VNFQTGESSPYLLLDNNHIMSNHLERTSHIPRHRSKTPSYYTQTGERPSSSRTDGPSASKTFRTSQRRESTGRYPSARDRTEHSGFTSENTKFSQETYAHMKELEKRLHIAEGRSRRTRSTLLIKEIDLEKARQRESLAWQKQDAAEHTEEEWTQRYEELTPRRYWNGRASRELIEIFQAKEKACRETDVATELRSEATGETISLRDEWKQAQLDYSTCFAKVVAVKEEMGKERLRIWEEARAESEADKAARREYDETRSNPTRTTRPSTSRNYTTDSHAEPTHDQERTRDSYDPSGKEEVPGTPLHLLRQENIDDMRKRQDKHPNRMHQVYEEYKQYVELKGYPSGYIKKVTQRDPAEGCAILEFCIINSRGADWLTPPDITKEQEAFILEVEKGIHEVYRKKTSKDKLRRKKAAKRK
jgi:hypothetical protein